MNKSEFVDKLVEKCPSDFRKYNGEPCRASAERIVNAVFDTISDVISNGDAVSINGFGTFTTVYHNEKTGINPQTKESIVIPAAWVPKFKASSKLKSKVKT